MQSSYNYHVMDSEIYNNEFRPSWQELYFNIAKLTAQRSNDPHTKVGAVLVKNGCVIGIGYNGAPRNFTKNINWHTEEKYKYVIHAELNAIANATNNNVAINGADLYLTLSPCLDCIKMIAQFQIKSVYYLKKYKDFKEVDEFAKACKIKLIQCYY